jgi:competence transcription factor ComK
MRVLIYKLLIAVFILLFSNLAMAQITITMDDVLNGIGTTEARTGDSSITINVGSSGENQSWDFRNDLKDSGSYTVEILNPGQTAVADSFPGANLAEYSGIPQLDQFTIDFYKVTQSNFVHVGTYEEFGTPLLYITSIQDTVSPLPLSYGSTWEKVNTDTLYYFYPDYIENIEIDSIQNTIDAYGTLHLPIGDFECLRLRIDKKINIQYFFPASAETKTQIEYHWISRNNIELASATSQSNETDPDFTNASYFEMLDSLNSNTVAVRDKDNRPLGFKLFQNYPNPFNPTTTIKYDLPKQAHVTLKVYNILGQKVATLLNGVKQAGSYEVNFNASNLSSGIYFYRLKTGQNILTKKMILLK